MNLRRTSPTVLFVSALSLCAGCVPDAPYWPASAGSSDTPTPPELSAPLASQPPSEPTSAPAAQPATASAPSGAPNPLRSPARMMEFFDAAVAHGRISEAQRCLNFARLDPEIVREKGDDYVRQLAEILARLEAEGLFDRQKLSDDPTAQSQTIGRDPLLLVVQRYEQQEELRPGAEREGETEDVQEPEQRTVRRWQFAEATVADIPDLHARLDELIAQIRLQAARPVEAPPDQDQEADPLRSPYHTVQHFFISVAGAKKDSAFYKDAMECLDFSEVDAADFEAKAKYVDGLNVLLEHLRATGFDREELPQQPEAETDTWTIGTDPAQLILVRGPDGRWRFRGRTVKGVPGMIEKLEQRRAREKAKAGQPPAAVAVAPPELYLDYSSPQATMNLFLTAMSEQDLAAAITCFDLSKASEADRGVAGLLAGKLWMVLNRHKLIVLQEIDSDRARAAPYAVLKHEAGQIWIDRQRAGDRSGDWLFSAASLRSIDRLYEAFEKKPILPELRRARLSFWALPALYVREYLVPLSMKRPLWGLQVWQWVGLAALLLLGLAIRPLCALVLPRIGRRLLQTDAAAVLPQTVRTALLPTSTLAMLLVWWAGLQFLDLGAAIMAWTWPVLKIVLAFAAVAASYRLIDLITAYFAARAAQTASRLDDVLVPLAQKALKVLVVALGLVFVAKTLGFKINPLLAGLGVGGLAFGLAAQDTLKNFFGSVNVVLDRPFQVGDWVKMGDVEGTVESVGLRSSRIRTFYNSQITVPNSEIMTARVDNLGRRRYRRISCMLSVTYDTSPEKLEAFCEGIRALIRVHPYTRKDYYHCWVNKFAASSIDILLYCFHEAPDWGTELRERHRLFLDIIRLAERLGVDWAFPTQTVHLHHDSSPPDAAPPPPSVPTESEAAMQFGANEAVKLAREAIGERVEKPAPVTY